MLKLINKKIRNAKFRAADMQRNLIGVLLRARRDRYKTNSVALLSVHVVAERLASLEVAPFVRTVFSIFKWSAGRSRCRFNRGQHREVSFVRGLVRQT
jgi:hypothetical protein